ncbi:MAG TPA: chemotaxis response regulator protein-glutamate methylesterase [Planctomycetota bacterium]|jgi:two-component system chemotaxis response regulator CheB|nr:chemotaxis response regulator protein-glutamate methylesterase [Planctomycetota bacterium]
MKPTRVLVVDDSAVVREVLSRGLACDPGINVVGSAPDAYAAWGLISRVRPDVITLDLEMPGMNGIAFLRRLLRFRPLPVVVVSSLTPAGSDLALQALEAGAVEVVAKPRSAPAADRTIALLAAIVKGAAGARIAPPGTPVRARFPSPAPASARDTQKIVVIGASTGGTQAIQQILMAMPETAPGIAIVQHMPEGFTRSFAERLNTLCAVEVKEAEDQDVLSPGRVLVAPGNQHLLVKKTGSRFRVEVKPGPLVSGHRPSVDLLFKSAARCGGRHIVGVLLTGMGKDGARGLLELRRAGGSTIAQDEASCVVYGMPREAAALDAAERVVALPRVAESILELA